MPEDNNIDIDSTAPKTHPSPHPKPTAMPIYLICLKTHGRQTRRDHQRLPSLDVIRCNPPTHSDDQSANERTTRIPAVGLALDVTRYAWGDSKPHLQAYSLEREISSPRINKGKRSMGSSCVR